MEIKKIFEKIRKREEEKEYFFALLLEEGKVKSVLWLVEGEAVRVLRKGEDQLWQNEEEILPVVDACLPPIYEGEKEPSRIIFGIPSYWTEGEGVNPAKIELLKRICREFDLTAIGFVIVPEAVAYYLKTVEGIPPTAILVGLGKKKITVTLVKLGKILGNEVVEKSGNLSEDVVEGISRFLPQEVIPSRIILYGEEGKAEKEELMNFPWNNFSELNFLHLPKVEILPSDFDISSVALAGGREVKKEEGINITHLVKEEVIKEEKKEEIPKETSVELKEPFFKEEEKKEELEEEKEKSFLESEFAPQEFGFVLEKDIVEEKLSSREIIPPQKEVPSSRETQPKKEISLPKINFSLFSGLFLGIKNFFSKISFSFLIPKGVKKASIMEIIVLFFVGGFFILAYWYLPKAEIILWVKPQIVEKNFTLKLDPKISAPKQAELVLPAEEAKVIINGQKKKTTTGSKLVGEPAKGEITIYNRTPQEKTFDAGTQIIGPNNLKFTLDEKVTVASESAGSDYTRIPGKAKVKVTAVAIGSEGNLVAGTEFSIANFSKSDYVAKNEEAFSGGTSREIQVVSKEDQEKLLKELTEELKSKALEELQKKVPSEKKLIEESLTWKIEEKNFDKKVGEEGDELYLNLKITFTALFFSEQDFQELAEKEIQKAIPPGFEYKPKETETQFTFKNITKEGVVVFDAYFKASLFPALNLEAIKKNLAGKYSEVGRAYLGSLPQVDSYEAKIFPRFPGKLATFPRIAKNIKIEIRKE
jgi:hypothetical protein